MKIEELSVESIKPYEKNPRKNDGAVNGVAESIKQFGFQQPIVIDKNGVIVAGHTRYKAALQLGMKTVPCVRADQLSPKQVKAYRILDNKLNELATWDFAALGEELASINFDFAGFDVDFSSFEAAFDKIEDGDEAKTTMSSPGNIDASGGGSVGGQSGENVFRYGVYVELDDEEAQRELYERLVEEGYNVRTTTI